MSGKHQRSHMCRTLAAHERHRRFEAKGRRCKAFGIARESQNTFELFCAKGLGRDVKGHVTCRDNVPDVGGGD